MALTPTHRQKDLDESPLLDITVSVLSRLVDRGLIARAAVDDEEDEEGQQELEAAQVGAASLGERFSTSRWHCRTRTSRTRSESGETALGLDSDANQRLAAKLLSLQQ